MMLRRLSVVVLACTAIWARVADASEIRSGFADDDFVIVWDGSKDVVPSRGYLGDTVALSALGLVDYADYAVKITYTIFDPGVAPRPVRVLRVVLTSPGLAAACAAASAPAFCARLSRMDA